MPSAYIMRDSSHCCCQGPAASHSHATYTRGVSALRGRARSHPPPADTKQTRRYSLRPSTLETLHHVKLRQSCPSRAPPCIAHTEELCLFRHTCTTVSLRRRLSRPRQVRRRTRVTSSQQQVTRTARTLSVARTSAPSHSAPSAEDGMRIAVGGTDGQCMCRACSMHRGQGRVCPGSQFPPPSTTTAHPAYDADTKQVCSRSTTHSSSLRRRLSRPRQVRRFPRTSPHRSSLTHSTQAVGRQDQGAVCRGFG